MYSTDERPGAQEECDRLSEALPAFNVETTIKKDPTATEMLRAIREVQDRSTVLSGLIVIIMSHGQRGAVHASDGPINIQQILLTMNSAKLRDKPKIFLFTMYYLFSHDRFCRQILTFT